MAVPYKRIIVADSVVVLEEIGWVNRQRNPIDAVAAVRGKKRVVVSAGGSQLLAVPRKCIIVAYSVIFLEEICRMYSEVNPIDTVAAVGGEQRVVIRTGNSQLLPMPRKGIIVADGVVFLEEISRMYSEVNPIDAVAAVRGK